MNQQEPHAESTPGVILHFLKTHGDADVKMVASHCGLTPMAAGRHLLRLAAAGDVEARQEKRPRGRPAKVYALTEQGDNRFSRRYAEVAVEILSSIEEMDGAEKVKEVFRRRRGKLESRYEPRVEGGDLEQKVRGLAEALSADGYMADVARAGGEWLLTLRNCAIREVAQLYPAACDEELCLVRNLLRRSGVERTGHVLAGDRHCCYRIPAEEDADAKRASGKGSSKRSEGRGKRP